MAKRKTKTKAHTLTPDTLTPDTLTSGRKGGAPEANTNATRHGLRASALPDGCGYISGQLRSLRRDLVTEVERAHKAVSFAHEVTIQSLLRHERRSLLAARWLRVESGLSLQDRLALESEIGRATEARDRCLARLEIGTADSKEAMLKRIYG